MFGIISLCDLAVVFLETNTRVHKFMLYHLLLTTTAPAKSHLLAGLRRCPDTQQASHRKAHLQSGREWKQRLAGQICSDNEYKHCKLKDLFQKAGVSLEGKPLELEMNFSGLDPFQSKPLQQPERFIYQHDVYINDRRVFVSLCFLNY